MKNKVMKKIKSIVMCGVAGVALCTTLMYASAYEGECNHGDKKPTYITYKTVAVNCISTGTHPCYVGGVLTECETYRYKFLNYQMCTQCNANGPSYYSYGPTIHEYKH